MFSNKKSLGIIFLVSVFSLALFSIQASGQSSAGGAAESLAQLGIINYQSSESGYRLGSTISRAEMIKIAVRLGGKNQRDCRLSSLREFTDVGTTLGDLCGYIEQAASMGMIRSRDDSSGRIAFRPLASVTRAEMVKMLLGAIGEAPSFRSALFSDVTSSLGDLEGYINRVTELGCAGDSQSIVGNLFRPRSPAMRGEVFQMAVCLREVHGTQYGVPSTGNTGTSTTTNSSNTTNNNSNLATSNSSSSSYIWSTTSYGACSKTCGEGVQSRTVSCKRTTENTVVASSYCMATGVQKPVAQKLCNVQACAGNPTTTSGGTTSNPGTSTGTVGSSTGATTSVPGFPWIINGVSYNSLTAVRARYPDVCIEINGIHVAYGFGPCTTGTSNNVTNPQITNTGTTTTSPQNTTCVAPSGFTCVTSPRTFTPPVIAGGSNIPYNINSSLTYKFSAGANQVHVHPIKFDSTYYSQNGATITTNMLSFNTSARDIAISTEPGNMVGVHNNPYCRRVNYAEGSFLGISFTGEPGKCNLSKDTQYYLNIKAADANTPVSYLVSQASQPGTTTSTTPSTTCAAPAGFMCKLSPLTIVPPVTNGGSNITITIPELRLGRTFRFSTPANTIHTFPILVSSSLYPATTYLSLSTNALSTNINPRDVVVSTEPGSMTPVNNNSRCKSNGTSASTSNTLTFDGNTSYCTLQKDVQYYLNIKPTNPNEPMDYLFVGAMN